MGWRDYFWKDPPNSIYEGSHSKLLKVSRSVSLVITLSIFLFFFISNPEMFFVFLTSWGATTTTIFFALAVLSMKFQTLDKVAFVVYCVIWSMEWVITVYFWSAIAPVIGITEDNITENILLHAVPLLLILFDFIWNRIQIFRQHYPIAWGVIILYMLTVNLPFALEVHSVYPGMTYTNAFTYLAAVGCFLLSLVSLELGRLAKKKQFERIQQKENLLEDSLTPEVV